MTWTEGWRAGAACTVGPEARPRVQEGAASPCGAAGSAHTLSNTPPTRGARSPQCFYGSVPREGRVGPSVCHPGRRAREDLAVHFLTGELSVLSAQAERKRGDGHVLREG